MPIKHQTIIKGFSLLQLAKQRRALISVICRLYDIQEFVLSQTSSKIGSCKELIKEEILLNDLINFLDKALENATPDESA